MSLWKRRVMQDLPTVPDDKAKRDEALVEARERLQRAVEKHAAVVPLVTELELEGQTNHYIERIRKAFGVSV